MRILYVFQLEYPSDVRVEKITSSLAATHVVHVLCRNRKAQPADESLGCVRVHRIGGSGLASITGFPAFFSPWWIRAGLRLIRDHQIDLVIVRDLPLCALALILRMRTGVPVVFDMAEDYPAMIADTWRFRGPSTVDYFVRNPRILRALEDCVLPRVDETWVVSEASRSRVLTRAKSRVRVVGNTPTVDILEGAPTVQTDRERLSIVYTGWVDETRGLDLVVRAIALAHFQGLPFTLRVVGDGSALPGLKRLAAELGVEAHVVFYGWMGQADLRNVIRDSDIGIVPHRVTAHTSTTLPNKIYDYMAFAKPVIVSDARALRDLVESEDCGLTFCDGDPESLLNCMRQIQSRSLRQQLGDAGRRAIVEKFNWSHDEATLLEAVACFRRQAREQKP